MANTAVNGTESTDCDRKTHDVPNPPLNLASEPLPKLSFFGHADSSKATIADRSAIDKEKLPGQTAITKTTNCVAYAFDNHDGNCDGAVQIPDIADGDDQQQLPDPSSATSLEPRPEVAVPPNSIPALSIFSSKPAPSLQQLATVTVSPLACSLSTKTEHEHFHSSHSTKNYQSISINLDCAAKSLPNLEVFRNNRPSTVKQSVKNSAQLPNLQCMLKTRSSRKHSSQRGKKCKARSRSPISRDVSMPDADRPGGSSAVKLEPD